MLAVGCACLVVVLVVSVFNSVVVLDDVISFGVWKVCYGFVCLVYYYLLFCCLVVICVVCTLVFCLRGVGWLFGLSWRFLFVAARTV